jgi:hypothetical protein
MKGVRARIEIDAPPGEVWKRLIEFRHWPEWGPSVRAVEADGQVEAVAAGVTGRVQTVLRLWLTFEITSFEEGRAWSWKVAGIAATGHRITPISPGRTAVEFSVPRLFAPYVWVLGRGLRKLKAVAEND